jgi:hypothetical protein
VKAENFSHFFDCEKIFAVDVHLSIIGKKYEEVKNLTKNKIFCLT